LTCPPWLARTITGQLHSTPFDYIYVGRFGYWQHNVADKGFRCCPEPLVFSLTSSKSGRVIGLVDSELCN